MSSIVVVGVGLTSRATADAVLTLLRRAHRLAGTPRVDAFATVENRLDLPAFRAAVEAFLFDHRDCAAARTMGFPASTLRAVPVPTPSATVAALTGTHSVAEAAARHCAMLLAADLRQGAVPLADSVEVLVPKLVADGVTVALARADPPPSWTRALLK